MIPAEGYLGCETDEWLISVKKLKLSPILSFGIWISGNLLCKGQSFYLSGRTFCTDSRESGNVVVVFSIQERDLHY